MLRSDWLPVKLRGTVGRPEREADRAWSEAHRPGLLPGMGPAMVGGVRRAAQTRSTNQGVLAMPMPAGHLRGIGEGRPLEPRIRQTMEAFFQADFSGVRVHEGPTARAIGALAFTLGEDLHFAPGLYDPRSRDGVALLGHELTHVVQQRDGRVTNPYGYGVAIVQDPVLEREADRMGQRVSDELWSRSSVGQPSMAGGHVKVGSSAAVRTSALWHRAVGPRPLAGSGVPGQGRAPTRIQVSRTPGLASPCPAGVAARAGLPNQVVQTMNSPSPSVSSSCARCGSTNISSTLLDQGSSDELYRCLDCGYRNDVSSARKLGKRLAELVKEWIEATGAYLIAPVDQSDHPGLKNLRDEFKSAVAGVCAAMTAYWVGLNYPEGSEQGDREFREAVANDNIKKLVVEQVVMNKQIDSWQHLVTDYQRTVNAYKALTGGLLSPDEVENPRLVFKPEYEDLSFIGSKYNLWRKAKHLKRAITQAQASNRRMMASNKADGRVVAEDQPIRLLIDKLEAESTPALYVVSLHPSNNWLERLVLSLTTDQSGHTFGVEIHHPRYRLMDANTGLWSCPDKESLLKLLRLHIETLYDIVGEFKNGSYTLWRYSLRGGIHRVRRSRKARSGEPDV